MFTDTNIFYHVIYHVYDSMLTFGVLFKVLFFCNVIRFFIIIILVQKVLWNKGSYKRQSSIGECLCCVVNTGRWRRVLSCIGTKKRLYCADVTNLFLFMSHTKSLAPYYIPTYLQKLSTNKIFCKRHRSVSSNV